MPLYEYYCAKCASKFERLQPLSRSDDTATCPRGHAGAARTLSMFATVTKGRDGEFAPAPSGGGCACGGGGCGH